MTGALTLPGAQALTLDASGALAINAPITVGGAGVFDLTAGASIAVDAPISVTNAGTLNLTAATQSVGGKSLVDLSFAPGASINYGATDNGGALNINGAAYTLVYVLTHVGLRNSNGDNALATSFPSRPRQPLACRWRPLTVVCSRAWGTPSAG